MKRNIPFAKMHGAGNDYVYVDVTSQPLAQPEHWAQVWSDRHKGIGSDGLILIDNAENADFRMRMYNNDGSEGLMCGNGVRCVAKYVYDHRMTTSKTIAIATEAGIKTIVVSTDDDNLVERARVNMGEPTLKAPQQLATPDGSMTEGTIEANGKAWCGTFVSMGNPHFVIFVDNINSINLSHIGPMLEHSSMFPQLCNIEFCEVRPNGTLRTRVWERGSGITQACGTGACATAVAAILTHRAKSPVIIEMDGGQLIVEWEGAGQPLYLTGPAETAFEGVVTIEE